MDRLDVRIKGHDKEIERMCNYHYQGFIESIQSLLQVRGQVESIKVAFKVWYRDIFEDREVDSESFSDMRSIDSGAC